MAFRLTGKDKEEYARLTKNSKNKLKRLSKKFGAEKVAEVTTDITLPSINSFTGRKEFNAWKDKQTKFTRRGNMRYQFETNDKGVLLSKQEISQMTRQVKRIQKRIETENKRLSELPFIQGGKQYGTVGNRMGLLKHDSDVTNLNAPLDFNVNRFRDRKSVDRRLDDLDRMAERDYLTKRRAQVKENFIFTLERSFNSDAEKLVERIRQIDSDDFYEMFLMYEEIDFKLYDSDGHGKDNMATETTLSRIDTYVDRYEKDKKLVENKLKDF